MLKVLAHGGAHHIAVCPVCRCRFEYDEVDLKMVQGYELWIACPECGERFVEREVKLDD